MKKFIQVLLLSLKHNRSLSNSSSSRWLLIPFNRTYFQGAGQGGAISPGGEGAELCFPARSLPSAQQVLSTCLETILMASPPSLICSITERIDTWISHFFSIHSFDCVDSECKVWS